MILEIDGGYAGIRFSACHFIPRHEKCSRLHGHSYIVRLRLEGDIGEDGMIMDFVVLKRELREIIEEMDHKTLLPTQSEEVKVTVDGESVEALTCGKRYVIPRMDVTLLDIPNTTAEEMARMMTLRMVADIDFPSNVRSVSIGLDEERGQTAWYTEVLRCRRPSCSCREGSTPPRASPRPWTTGARSPRSASGTARGTPRS
ncbi:MAG: 6-pyruvoyl tetrahydropterin synthase family protein [Thermoplasmata archaeon]|nr:6-pyruvoyl tetrahydropterin synthase family protein [Thermoplasmata archaeon]